METALRLNTRAYDRSYAVWLGLMAYVVAVKLIISYAMPAIFRDPSQSGAFSWPALAIWTVAGMAGIWFASQTGFPGALSEKVTPRLRYVWPCVLGLAFGVAYVIFDRLTGYSSFMTALHGQPAYNIAFPANVLIYPAGAIIVEVIYRLLPMTLIMWVVSRLILRGRGEVPIFWILAVLTSAIEPLTQDVQDAAMGTSIMLAVIALDYSLNFTQAVFFRRAGFLASILVRVAFYAVWHMLYVH